MLTSFNIPPDLPAGISNFSFPTEMKESEKELLFLINSTNESMKGSKRKLEPRGVYVADLPNDKIQGVKMDWWNDADYDFGYQWISKLIRDPVTRNIVGSGIRAPHFYSKLKATNILELGRQPATRHSSTRILWGMKGLGS